MQNARHVKQVAVHSARHLVAPVALNWTKRGNISRCQLTVSVSRRLVTGKSFCHNINFKRV